MTPAEQADVTQELPRVVLDEIAHRPRLARGARTPPSAPPVAENAPQGTLGRSPTPWRVTNALTELWRRPDSGRRLNRALWRLVQVQRRLGVIVVER